MLRRRDGGSGRRASSRASAAAAEATSTAPASTTSANSQPSCARTARGSPSFAIPGRARPTAATAPPTAPSTIAPRLSTRSGSSTTQPSRGEAGEDDPEARVREHERDDGEIEQQHAGGAHGDAAPRGAASQQREGHGDRAEQRELVPVAERRPQPREPAVVRIERRDALREQRPAEHEPEQHRGARRRRCAVGRRRSGPSTTPRSAKAA